MSTPARAAALACVTALVTIASQVLVHRIVSAKLINNYAFLVISLTMLGFAASGVALTRLLPRVLRNLGDAMTLCASLFALSSLGVSALFYRADTGAFWVATRSEFTAGFLRCLPLALLYALPFAFAGLILGALLSAPELPARRIYFWDLLGSSCGALAVLPAISILGVETSLAAASGLLVLAALVLTPPRGRGARLGATCATLPARCSRGHAPPAAAWSSSTWPGTRSRASRSPASRPWTLPGSTTRR